VARPAHLAGSARSGQPGPVDDDRAGATDAASLIARLAAVGCVAPAEEAAELLAASSGPAWLEQAVTRRGQGEPLAWITGRTSLGGVTLSVAAGTYVPRPQSTELVRRAAGLLPRDGRAADLCTGTGAVAAAIAARRPGVSVVGVDLDPAAVRCAVANGVPAVVADLADSGAPLPDHRFDVVTAVAPYVPTGSLDLLPSDVVRHEPRRALDGGPDGLAIVRPVVGEAARLLRPGGWLLVELGGDQHHRLAGTLAADGFGVPRVWHDEEGDLRGLAAPRPT